VPELPSGTATLLFSDIGRSTELVKFGALLHEYKIVLGEVMKNGGRPLNRGRGRRSCGCLLDRE
jgi:hypothetical protein